METRYKVFCLFLLMNANVSTEAEMLYLNRSLTYKEKYILVTFLIVVTSQLDALGVRKNVLQPMRIQ